jgi:protein-disulfide isomerase
MKEFPILGPVSDLSAKYALAAMKQGRYREFHAALMNSAVAEHQLTDGQLRDFAKAAGVDVERMVKDSQDPEIAGQIAATHSLATSLGVSATPGLFVGTRPYNGPRTAEAILKEVAAVRGKG